MKRKIDNSFSLPASGQVPQSRRQSLQSSSDHEALVKGDQKRGSVLSRVPDSTRTLGSRSSSPYSTLGNSLASAARGHPAVVEEQDSDAVDLQVDDKDTRKSGCDSEKNRKTLGSDLEGKLLSSNQISLDRRFAELYKRKGLDSVAPPGDRGYLLQNKGPEVDTSRTMLQKDTLQQNNDLEAGQQVVQSFPSWSASFSFFRKSESLPQDRQQSSYTQVVSGRNLVFAFCRWVILIKSAHFPRHSCKIVSGLKKCEPLFVSP